MKAFGLLTKRRRPRSEFDPLPIPLDEEEEEEEKMMYTPLDDRDPSRMTSMSRMSIRFDRHYIALYEQLTCWKFAVKVCIPQRPVLVLRAARRHLGVDFSWM